MTSRYRATEKMRVTLTEMPSDRASVIAGIASGVQRAADQLGGASGVAVYVGLGFAPALHGGDPFVIAAVLAVAGLIVGAAVISRSPATTVAQPQPE